jgi:hypothetical protein
MMFTACCRNGFKAISRAAAKAASAKFRERGVLRVDVNWNDKATLCERCPMRVIRGGVSYCGEPFLENPDRDPIRDGCGCPTIAKAKTPGEHCPLNARYDSASIVDGNCDCRWCMILQRS